MSKASQIRQKAQEFLGKGQIDKAIQEYRRLISIESKNPNLYNELGDIYLRAGDKPQAVQNYEKAATIYEKVALYNNAVAVCKKVLRVEPEKADTVFKLSELRAKQKLEGEAVAFFAQYADIVLANPQALLQRSQKDVERMLELLPASEPIMDRAAELLERIGLKLKAAELLVKLSSIAARDGDGAKQKSYDRKLDEIKSALSPEEAAGLGAVPLSETAVPPSSAEEHAAEPAASPRAGAGLERPSEPSPVSPAAASGASPQSRETAQPREPKESPAPAEKREREESREPAEQCSPSASAEPEVDPSVREAVDEAEMVAAMSGGAEYLGRGLGSGDIPQRAPSVRSPADRTGEETKVRATTEVAAPGPRGEDRTGTGPQRETPDGLVEEITSDVEKDDLKSHYDLGMAYLEMGLYTEAIRDFQIASRGEGLQLSSMEMIGYCFLRNDQPRLAVKQLTRALEIAKASGAESLGIHYNLGLAHEMLGELEPAREHFEEVYIIDMSFRDVAEKMKKLSPTS